MDVRHKKKRVCLYYPRAKADGVEADIIVELYDTRAADDIRITYDFDRDGWVIWQAQHFAWASDDMKCDPGWKESAFCPAYQYDREGEELK